MINADEAFQRPSPLLAGIMHLERTKNPQKNVSIAAESCEICCLRVNPYLEGVENGVNVGLGLGEAGRRQCTQKGALLESLTHTRRFLIADKNGSGSGRMRGVFQPSGKQNCTTPSVEWFHSHQSPGAVISKDCDSAVWFYLKFLQVGLRIPR